MKARQQTQGGIRTEATADALRRVSAPRPSESEPTVDGRKHTTGEIQDTWIKPTVGEYRLVKI